MPATYAHYKFGEEVRKALPEQERKTVEEFPELFRIGLHGPDIFFYYKPFAKTRVRQIGLDMHKCAGKDFFAPAVEVVKEHGGNHAYLAYLYGFICHFALDVACHGYVDEKIAKSGISHTEIEAEFDRMLMEKDGHDPIRYKPTGHIVPSMDNAVIIQTFFEEANSAQILGTLKDMVSYLNILVAPSKKKRFLIDTVLKMTGNYKELHGLMINYMTNRKCEDSTRELFNRYSQAKDRAVLLIHEYSDFLEGKEALSPIYQYTFGSKKVEEEMINEF